MHEAAAGAAEIHTWVSHGHAAAEITAVVHWSPPPYLGAGNPKSAQLHPHPLVWLPRAPCIRAGQPVQHNIKRSQTQNMNIRMKLQYFKNDITLLTTTSHL